MLHGILLPRWALAHAISFMGDIGANLLVSTDSLISVYSGVHSESINLPAYKQCTAYLHRREDRSILQINSRKVVL
jgi:hypothetical protein